MKNLGERVFLIIMWPVVFFLDLCIYLVMGKGWYKQEREVSRAKFKQAWNSLNL